MHGRDPELLLRRGEAALRKAKAAEPPVQAWSTAMEPSDPRRLARVGELRKALERDELEVHYQPKVALCPAARSSGVEALVRWRHPVDGLLASDEFLPMAERTGLVVPLTRVVLRMALQQCRRWLDSGRRVPVAVNLSVRGLLDPDLTPTVARPARHLPVAAGHAQPGDHRELGHGGRPARRCRCSRSSPTTGWRSSVDDFGTGYSSLAYLRQLPVNEVKIDKSFVRDMGTEESDAAIVSTIIGLARQLGCRWWPRASRTRAAATGSSSWAATSPRATCSAVRCRPTGSTRGSPRATERPQPGPAAAAEACDGAVRGTRGRPGVAPATGRPACRLTFGLRPFSSVGRASPW